MGTQCQMASRITEGFDLTPLIESLDRRSDELVAAVRQSVHESVARSDTKDLLTLALHEQGGETRILPPAAWRKSRVRGTIVQVCSRPGNPRALHPVLGRRGR